MRPLILRQRLVAAVLVAASLAVACQEAALDTPTSPTSAGLTTSTTTSSATAVSGETCATGDGVNDAGACNTDARVYCAGFHSADWRSYASAHGYTTASWKYGLLDCLGKHDVSVACTNSLDRREVLNAQMMAACATYCRGTSPQPGAEPCVDRLKSIYASLDNACRAALDGHEAAKPLDGHCSF
jgi:hypothetical protein